VDQSAERGRRPHDGCLRTFTFGEDHATGASDSDFAFAEDGQGCLWLGTAEGAVHSRRRRPTPASTPTPLLLDAQINGRDADGLDRFSLRTDDALSLRYATLAFPGDDLRYQYRLTGTPDSTWSAPTADNTLRLQTLSRGARTLELRAKKGGGHHWSTALQVPVRVRPVWYRT